MFFSVRDADHGSQQKLGDRLKVTAQLLNAHDASHVWANTYNREIGDLFRRPGGDHPHACGSGRAQDRASVAKERRRAGQRTSLCPDWVCRDRQRFLCRGERIATKVQPQAIAADPNSQYGYIGMAWSYRNDSLFWHKQENNPDEALKRAAEYADKAILLAPDDAQAHHIRARIHTEAGEMEQAIAQYDQAIALNPSDSKILDGSAAPLIFAGRTNEAIELPTACLRLANRLWPPQQRCPLLVM